METIFRCCAGLDVHKESVQACLRVLDESGRLKQEVRGFGTMTGQLQALRDWLKAAQVTHVAMESTGVYWKPIYNILEEDFEVLLVNARHVKHVPGRKTDVADCQWLAQLLQSGLLRGSFIPERTQRDLRDLTRHRTQLINEQTRVANRVHKTLEDANIKLASVASDILGVSGREMIEALIAGVEDPQQLAQAARTQLQKKIPELEQALQGRLREHHRFMLRSLMDHLGDLERQIRRFDERIEELMRPFAEPALRLDAIPGINQRSAQNILSEIGVDMSRFPTEHHLCSWCGMAPGNNESAGKRKSGKTTQGNRWLRRTLVQAAWAATRKKNSYFQAQYRRLVKRRGKKRALVAVGHSILVVIYHMLKDNRTYEELGADFFDRKNVQKIANYHLQRLKDLGLKVTVDLQKKTA